LRSRRRDAISASRGASTRNRVSSPDHLLALQLLLFLV